MRKIGSTSGVGAPLAPNRVGGDEFIRRVGDRLVMDMHEGCGPTIRDLSGRGNSGLLSGNPAWERNRINFDGVNDHINSGNNANLDIVNELTALVFANPTDRSGAPQILLSKANYEMREYDDEYIWQALGINTAWAKSGDIGDRPLDLCVYDGKLYANSPGSDDIYVFDGISWTKSGDVGTWPSGLCVYDGRLYVACFLSSDVYVFDGISWTKSGDVGANGSAFCVYDGRLYITCDLLDDIYVFDGISWTKSGDVGTRPSGLCVYNGKLYVSCYFSDDIYVFDGVSWTKSGDVGNSPYGLCVYNGKLYVSCDGSSDVYVFDGAIWIKSGDVGTSSGALCVYDGKLYVSCNGSDDIYVFNGSTWVKSGDVGTFPYGLSVYDGKLYVSCFGSDDVYVFGSGKAIRKDKPLNSTLIAGYYKSNEIGISRNGEAFSTVAHTLTTASLLLDLHIGKGYGSSQSGLFGGNDERFQGLISFVRINATALSVKQALQDYLWNRWRN